MYITPNNMYVTLGDQNKNETKDFSLLQTALKFVY